MNGTDKTTEQLLEKIGQLESTIASLKKSVNESEQIADAFTESEERYKDLIQNAHSCIAIYKAIDNGKNFIFLEFNQMAEKVEQLLKEEVIGKRVTEVFPGVKKFGLLKVFQDVWKTGNSKLFPVRIYKDNRIQGYRENYVYKLSSGEIVAVYQDYTERERIKEALMSSEERLKIIFECAPDAIYLNDLKGTFLDGNKAAEDVLGYKREELIGSNFLKLKLLNSKGLLKASGLLVKNLQGKGTGPDEFVVIRKDGSQIAVEISTYPVTIEGQTVVLGVARDITERKKAEEILKNQNIEYAVLNKEYETQNKLLRVAVEKAEESDRLKSAFLANISHEIRTPMNGILGFSELLKEPGLSGDEQKNYISVIENSGERMLNTINDLIEMSKLEACQMYVSLSEMSTSELLKYIYNFFKPEVEKKGLQFTYIDLVPEYSLIIKTDREKLYGILTNLVKNAIKYTNNGSIEFGYQLKDNSIEFYVKDTGIGISNDLKQIIFERFVQADMTKSISYEGSGLGLAITKAYVELLGGQIWLESEEGKGSCFYFSLPIMQKK